MKTQQQIEKFIGTVENLIPKFEEKKLEYLRQGDEFGFNVMKGKIKERLIELNTVRWVLDNSSINEECVSMDAQELKRFESVYQPSKEITFCWLRKQYVQLSTEENHTDIVDHANDSLLVWKAAKAQANKNFEDFIDQAIEDSACADERRSLQSLLDEFKEQNNE